MANETAEWVALNAAEAAFKADGTMAALAVLEAAEAVYFPALSAAKASFEAMNLTADERNSAECNADDTVVEEGSSTDRLRWYQAALSTATDIIDFRPAMAA